MSTNLEATGRSTSPPSPPWPGSPPPHFSTSPTWPPPAAATPPCFQTHADPTLSLIPPFFGVYTRSNPIICFSLVQSSHALLVLTFQVLGWVGSHVVSSLGLSRRASAIMNPIKALGLNDGGGLASPTIIGPHGQLARHQQPIIAIKSIRALSLARKPFELAAHGWLDQ